MQERKLWLNGQIVSLNDAKIHVLSPTAQFGANVFEGIRCYWNNEKKALYAFRLEEHFNRLERSVRMFRMYSPYTRDVWEQAFHDCILVNKYQEDIAIRQTIFIDGDSGSWFSQEPVGMFIAPIAKARKSTPLTEGVRCCVSSWERINERCLSPKIKVGGNYLNSRLAHIEAKNNGYDTAIFLGRDGYVSEGTGSCFFMIRNDTLITPPLNSSILESITRETILELARKELGLNVEERPIDRTELYICQEAFFAGSAVEVTPIIHIDGYDLGRGAPGFITTKLHETYIKTVSGDNFERLSWLTKINI